MLVKLIEIVKKLFAILFSVLLVWMQIAPVSVSAVCVKPAMGNCADCCGRMGCCAAKPASNSQPAPAVPTQSNAQNQISLLAPSVVAWNLPQSPACLVSSASASPLLAMAAPLYARNCSLLL
jgi:hypothetical protein